MAQRRPEQRARSRAAVIPLPSRVEGVAILRLLPSGRSLLLGFALVVGAAGLYLLARATPMFALRTIEVEGGPPAVAAHVRAAIAPLEGTSLLALDGAEIQRRVAGLTDVAAASYDRDFPHTLRIVVRAEHPVAVARDGANAWLVSAGARVIAPTRAGARPGLPRVWLTESGKPEVGAVLTDRLGLRAVRALALARRAHFRARITMVRARAHELTFRLESGLELRLGDLRAVPLKLAVASRVLPELSPRGGYGYLDVSVPERPVAGQTLNPKV
ncbi:MAG: FtsQ-type POTRA domain-containing protein [Actinobacteria bacterium]|nr:MAG: FtsQ-type POTRA domain-containing protein [Actinomycetota bacterium]